MMHPWEIQNATSVGKCNEKDTLNDNLHDSHYYPVEFRF